MKEFALLLVLLALIANVSCQDVRLPKPLVPELYDIVIKTYLDESDVDRRFTFDGQSTVMIRCITATNQITMHARDIDLDIASIQVKREPSGQVIAVQAPSRDQSRETLTITLPVSLAINDRISVLIKYKGYHRDDQKGFFKMAYQQDNQTRTLVAAHMQANFAHRVFPCFDEPAFRANFTVKVQHRQGRRAWSNMPAIIEKDIGNGWRETSFSTSPQMSTYIFSLFVADYQCANKSTTRNVKVSVCARPDAVRSGLLQFALNEAVAHFQFFENYFEVPLPLTKYDLMAIPNYQWFAVENWGLLYFNEFAILSDPVNAKPRSVKQTSNLIAHEVAHQWDGDLVTFDWWNDFWLKEGAANWLEYLASSSSQPTWNDVQLVLENHYAMGLNTDALANVRPLSYPDVTLASMERYFTVFNYAKATSLIRMLNGALGENTFRKGYGNFFRTRAYSAVTANDLWQAMTDQARRDNTLPVTLTVKDFMNTWTEQPGFPVLNVSRQSDGTLALTQKRFLVDPTANPMNGVVAPYNFRWWLPISWASSSNGQIRLQPGVQWMGPSTTPTLTVGQSPNWYLVNIDAYGFYRVQYENDNWQLLATQLRTDRNQIPTLTRAQLMMDSYALNRAELLSPVIYLRLMASMKYEQEYIVWSTADVGIPYMTDILEQRPVFSSFKQFISCQLSDHMDGINMDLSESEKPLQARLKRQLIVTRACYFGVPQCVTTALRLWANWRSRPNANPIVDDMRSIVYCTALQRGTTDDWNFAYNKTIQPGYPEDEVRNLRKALACTSNVDLLRMYLNTLKQNGTIKPNNQIETMGFLLENLLSRQVARNWLIENREWTQQQLIPSPAPLATMLRDTLCRKMVTDADLTLLKTLEGLFANSTEAKPIFNEAVKQVSSNIRWRNANEDIISSGLIDIMNTSKCGSGSLDVTKPTIILSLLLVMLYRRLFRH